MKKLFTLAIGLIIGFQLSAQNIYWVFFKDKQNTSFNPTEYFDAKALQRYESQGINTNDISNYPLNSNYKSSVIALSEGYVGQSRWFNAVAVEATPAEIDLISALPFVSKTQEIQGEMLTAENKQQTATVIHDATLRQVSMMQGEAFQKAGITGKGVRVAILDGGFPDVNTHPAFKHIRDNNRIVKTWNFVSKKENVYVGHYHGRMVMSCIGGIMNDTTLLGLAPDAEFLLARTEVEAEKKKEEVWWIEALEWADQNGADIVNSSLGYTDCRYTTSDMDGKTSLVAKAASKAASKGILVCTAMGNEGSNDWRVLVTPADADSVLSVGAVESLERLSYYSSYGPTADGRRKPNVVACGKDLVAERHGNYDYNEGTSFATPLVAGFAACVKQLHPEWSTMQLLQEIEKSGNHYPYYDYAYGYGIPQATYFTNTNKKSEKAFTLCEDENKIYIIPTDKSTNHKLFYNITNGDGSIEDYDSELIEYTPVYEDEEGTSKVNGLYFLKNNLKNGQTLKLWYNNQYAEYVMGKDKLPQKEAFENADSLYYTMLLSPSSRNYYESTSKDIFNSKMHLTTGFFIPSMWSNTGNIHQTERISRSLSVVWDNSWNIGKVYRLGFRLGFGSNWYSVDSAFTATQLATIGGSMQENTNIKKSNIKTTQFDLEIFQRFKLSRGAENKSWFIDTGIYGEWITGSHYKMKLENPASGTYPENTLVDVQHRFIKGWSNNLDYGVRLRVGYAHFALFGQYRISNILKEGNDLPRIQVGIQLF